MHERGAGPVARKAAVAAVVLAAVVTFAEPAPAHGQQRVRCGQTITHSLKLANDLSNCPGDGLIAGADRITIDLDGHTVDGVADSGTCEFPAVAHNGIANAGNDRVTIEGGTVQQFDFGVSADGMSHGRVHDMTLRENRFDGVNLTSHSGAAANAGNRIDHNLVTNTACDAGLELNTGRDNLIDDNRVQTSSSGIGICCGESTDANVVEHNRISGIAEIGILVFSSGAGQVVANTISDADVAIEVNGATTSGLVRGNSITRTRGPGILVTACCGDTPDVPTGIRVVGNSLTATNDGIWLVDSDRDIVAGNSVLRAGGPGGFGSGILLNGASDARLWSNTIIDGAGFAPGIVLGLPPEFGPSPRPVDGNLVAHNTVSGQQADGIAVFPIASATILRANTAEHNAGDGINVMSAATTITRNTADLNGAFGIEAVPGVTDGGGNHARGNENPTQCTGVACQ